MESREDCLHEASECDRLAKLANTRATRTLLAVAAFQAGGKSSRTAKAFLAIGAGSGTAKLDSAGQRQRFADTGACERLFQALQHSGIAMETLACIDVFDLNNPGAPPARGVDSMHAEPAIANEPGHH
jgi:hypothetical protein